MIHAYRIVKTKRATTAFDGKGASITGGRWNSVGTPMVYLAESPALAAMEMLVHFDESSIISSYSLIPVEFPEACLIIIGDINAPQLPSDWQLTPAPVECAQVGDSWIQSEQSLVLRVPSAVAPYGMNYLLNQAHPDFKRLQIGATEGFSFDSRIIEKMSVGVSKK